jgi:hypothetical protein
MEVPVSGKRTRAAAPQARERLLDTGLDLFHAQESAAVVA